MPLFVKKEDTFDTDALTSKHIWKSSRFLDPTARRILDCLSDIEVARLLEFRVELKGYGC